MKRVPRFGSFRGLEVSIVLVGALFWAVGARGADYFVAPGGADGNSGTISSPFATIMKAQDAASSGDTVYLRGGTYVLVNTDITQHISPRDIVNYITKDGISYVAYSDEVPVFDFSGVQPVGNRVTAFYVTADNCVFEGFEVVGVQVTIAGTHTQSECFLVKGGDNNRFERLSMHDGMGIGWYLIRGGGNEVINCDAYNNKGLDGSSHGNIDGFGVHPDQIGNAGNKLIGCRAWFNSDDGFDLISADAAVVISNCWSMNNGYDYESPSTKIGDSTGFKAGGYGISGGAYPTPVPRHVVQFCLAIGSSRGFYANHHTGGIDWVGNTAIGNGVNYNMLCNTEATSGNDVPGFDHYMKNNLGFHGNTEVSNLGDTNDNDISSNYWNLPVNVTSADFQSLEESLLTQPRQADGSLPVVDYARLVEGSDLIDAGTDVGFAYAGTAPDLGAFEYGLSNPPPSVAELLPVADTHVRYGTNQDNNYGTAATLDTRQNDTAPRDYMVYIRFDLSSISGQITNAELQLTKASGDSLVNRRIRVLGLDNAAGSTMQNWDELSLTWNTLGAEVDTSIYPSPSAGESPFDFGRITDFEQGVSGISEVIRVGDTVAAISGSALADWLESRRQDGGLATLIIDYPSSASDKSVNYHSREAASGQPMLTIEYLSVALSGYEVWLTTFPALGTNTSMTADPDDDGVNNFDEYGLGGDPNNGNDPGQQPVVITDAESWLYYIHPQRQGVDDIAYTLESTDDLVSASWSNMFYEVTGTGLWNQVEGFGAITNQVPHNTANRRFFRLRLEAL